MLKSSSHGSFWIYSVSIGLFAFGMSGAVGAQTFTGTGGGIPDDATYVEFELEVSGLVPDQLDTTAFGLEQVCIDLDHEYLGSVDVSLIAPDGTLVILTSNVGGNSTAYENTCFRHDASTSIFSGWPPYSGNYRPVREIGFLNNGNSGNGTWKLRVFDIWGLNGPDGGTVHGWSLTFGDEPAKYTPFLTSDLPIVVIDTDGEHINEHEKIMATMFVVDNGPGMENNVQGPYNDHQGNVGIKWRGQSSLYAPKKSYTVELWDVNGEDMSAPVLGMPSGEDWVLVANHYDRSLLHNSLTYHIAAEKGHYAPRQKHVELVVNGQYMGLYLFVENIKRGAHRVNIAKLDSTENSGDDLTGGYIISLDKSNITGWNSQYAPVVAPQGQTIHFHYEYPRADRITPQQASYIQAYVDSFETALAGEAFMDPVVGYAAFMDIPSFVDYFILNELSRNVDAYRISTYLHKDKNSNGGKLKIGPVWDYDIAWGNANFCNGNDVTGWAYEIGGVCPNEYWQVPFWWQRLLQDPLFTHLLGCRWEELRDDILSTAALHEHVDAMAQHLDAAQQRNFAAWETMGIPVWPNPTPVPQSYQGEIDELKQWITARAEWLDGNMPGAGVTCTTALADRTSDPDHFSPYPNPFFDHVLIQGTTDEVVHLSLSDAAGRIVQAERQLAFVGGVARLDLPMELQPGIYILRIEQENGHSHSFRLMH